MTGFGCHPFGKLTAEAEPPGAEVGVGLEPEAAAGGGVPLPAAPHDGCHGPAQDTLNLPGLAHRQAASPDRCTGLQVQLDFILLLFPNRMGFGSARTESHSVRLSVLPCQCSVYRLCSQRWN